MMTQDVLPEPPSTYVPTPCSELGNPADRNLDGGRSRLRLDAASDQMAASAARLTAQAEMLTPRHVSMLRLTAVPPPPRPDADPDATVVIGRHRADGTRDTPAAAAVPARRRFVGRVAAAVAAKLRRRGGAQ